MEIYLFSILWLLISGASIYEIMKKNFSEEDEETLFDQLQEIQRFVSPTAISKMLLGGYLIFVLIDIVGFGLAYIYAYAQVNLIYYRIMFFFACACIYLTDQTLGLRSMVRMSAAIRKLEEKPWVLERWLKKNDPSGNTFDTLTAISKFTIALQLFLFSTMS